ncbi:DNA/RNA polymerases superfamily protein [Gossypium australe]|uniref:DNA/RNA polymerases superfamily protein n=1 Tax=Gossypium australe TaxID=47621 RepID=A0A5B6UWS1_9ROSI|nr:DNA/RNA polymerases superfamily protein [Gossypium australe]
MAPYKETEDKVRIIRDNLKTVSDRQKSAVDLKRKVIEFFFGEKVFLKVSLWRKVLRFGKKGKFCPRFIGLYEILERTGPVTYRLALPLELDRIHNAFHVLMIRRYRSDLSYVLSTDEIDLQPDLTYNEEPSKF